MMNEMTPEEARKILINIADQMPSDVCADWIDAVCIGIKAIDKALEQGDVLDKIEEEINSPNRGTCDYFIVDRIEEIINKYKAESEDAE